MLFKKKNMEAYLRGILLFMAAALGSTHAQASAPITVFGPEFDTRIEKATALVKGADGVVKLVVRPSEDTQQRFEGESQASGKKDAEEAPLASQ